MDLSRSTTKIGLAATGVVVGAVLAGTYAAQAASPSPSPSPRTTAEDPNPGDNGADGVPEAQEHHGGGHGRGLDLSGTVTAVGSSTVTIKTSAGTKSYTVTSSSDIDKNGEATLKDLAVGDAVTFSVGGTPATQIDKLHAGDEAKDRPTGAPDGSTAGPTGLQG